MQTSWHGHGSSRTADKYQARRCHTDGFVFSAHAFLPRLGLRELFYSFGGRDWNLLLRTTGAYIAFLRLSNP